MTVYTGIAKLSYSDYSVTYPEVCQHLNWALEEVALLAGVLPLVCEKDKLCRKGEDVRGPSGLPIHMHT